MKIKKVIAGSDINDCDNCGYPLDSGDEVYWSESREFFFCSRSCALREQAREIEKEREAERIDRGDARQIRYENGVPWEVA